MKKKILAITLCVAMLAIMLVSGTLAYFTDTDEATNVMAVGSVVIEQVEQERKLDEDGNFINELQPFTQNKPVVPAVGTTAWAEEGVTVNGTDYKIFDDASFKNVIDKIVTVENKGKSPAFIRTIIAIEAPGYDPKDLIGINYNTTDITMSNPICAEIDGVKYVCFVYTYQNALASGAKSAPSLVQVYLDSLATNEDAALFGETWEILALSQAVQADGFADAATGLNEAFGEVTAAKLVEWFAAEE